MTFARYSARRIAPELVVVDSAPRPGEPCEGWRQGVLDDGSRHRVFKRFPTAADLVRELGGGEVLMDGAWSAAVRRAWDRPAAASKL